MTVTSPALSELHELQPTRVRLTPDLLLVYVVWALMLFEPEWLLSAFGGRAVLTRIPTVLMVPLAIVILRKWRMRALYLPLLVFFAMHLLDLVYATNRGATLGAVKAFYPKVLLFMASVCVLDTPAKCMVLVKMLVLSFLWFGLQGLPSGTVGWHSQMSNEDTYGPFMGLAVGMAYVLASGARTRKWRYLTLAATGIRACH